VFAFKQLIQIKQRVLYCSQCSFYIFAVTSTSVIIIIMMTISIIISIIIIINNDNDISTIIIIMNNDIYNCNDIIILFLPY
jgi:hypothetical protein